MRPQQKLKARRATDKEIEQRLKGLGPQVREEFDKHLGKLLEMMEQATDDSKESLVGFLYAFSSVSNEIARRNNVA